MKQKSKKERIKRKHKGIRKKIKGVPETPRLFIYKSLNYIYAGISDDTQDKVLCGVSSKKINAGKNIEAAKKLGKEIAKIAVEKGMKKVVFDRSGYLYHGKVKAFADAAREAGLEF